MRMYMSRILVSLLTALFEGMVTIVRIGLIKQN